MLSKKIVISFILSISVVFSLFSQEKLLSASELYFDFLALDGFVERPYLNYRTLSDSKWEHPASAADMWKLGAGKQQTIKIYGPELYTSYNHASPYGQNDGLLWQGRGLNAYFTAGLRLEKKGFELTFKPEITFSENLPFAFMTPAYTGELYSKKASVYGYYGIMSVDAPQRFGNKSFFKYGWGDSEIRYAVKRFTIGIGTQYLWLGHAKINPIMHSNNAPAYPKIDFGIRQTNLRLFGVNLGKVEGRIWMGQLSESDYFDNDTANDHNLLSGLSLGYAPAFLKGFTLAINRTYLCPWSTESLYSVPELLFPRLGGDTSGNRDEWDQRASIGLNYSLPLLGFEIYSEAGINDYSPGIDGYIRHPFHSMVYTIGLRKSAKINRFNKPVRGEFLLEMSHLEMSQDFQFQWASTFYAHHLITQGYTNAGQWLAAGNGTGGNSQYAAFKVYYSKGNLAAFIHRKNPDNDYIYQFSVGTAIEKHPDGGNSQYIRDFKTVLSTGLNSIYFARPNFQLSGGISYIIEHNPLYNAISWSKTSKLHCFRLEAGIVYSIR